MKILNLSIITPEGTLYEGECMQAVMPGSEGVFGVLAGHMTMIAQLKPGIVYVHLNDGMVEKIAISDGIADVSNEKCTLLVEKGQMPSNIADDKVKEKIELIKHQLLKADTEALSNSLTIELQFLEAILEAKKSI